ncbi:MAG TPA: hypothetical protein VMU87_03290 [Stellaceae bacterium]|nr:hypothetical protein [Stellaceae bacterium]
MNVDEPRCDDRAVEIDPVAVRELRQPARDRSDPPAAYADIEAVVGAVRGIDDAAIGQNAVEGGRRRGAGIHRRSCSGGCKLIMETRPAPVNRYDGAMQ